VAIPAGQCDWGSNELVLPGGISVKGGGKFLTVIRGSALTNDALLTVDCSNNRTSTISDLMMVGKANISVWDGGLSMKGGCKDFRVFNARFQDFIYYGVGVWGNARGVIYRNEFSANYRYNPNGNAGYGVVIYGDGTWPALELGSANAVFIEDNYFVANRHHIASNNGSRYVFRNNTAVTTNDVRHSAIVDAHGKGSSPHGSRSWEIYNNTFSTNLTPGLNARSMIGIRGGDGVVYSNTLTNSPSTVNGMVELSALEAPSPYPAADQMRSGYFWNNTPSSIMNGSPAMFMLGRDYFLTSKPGYVAYAYPHPLRSQP
jgi:hypothetical protein